MEEHSIFYSDHDSVHEVVGVKFSLDVLQMHSDRPARDSFCVGYLFDDLSHYTVLKDSGFPLREECAGAGTLERLDEYRHD